MCFPRRFLYLSPRHTVRLKEVAMAANWTPFQVIRSSVRSSFARGDACLEALLNTCPWREPAAPELFRESLDTRYNEQVWVLRPLSPTCLYLPLAPPPSRHGEERGVSLHITSVSTSSFVLHPQNYLEEVDYYFLKISKSLLI